MSGKAAPPLSDAAFARLMARRGPFEPSPLLALAVSGGADSMALALLASAWARAQGGEAVALTVDHRLRPESAAEAAAVGDVLRALGVRHEILPLGAAPPQSGVESAARAGRYHALTERCRALGALHLLTAHHADDQAETVLLRLCRGSGPDGLAGMAAARNLGEVRLLRPLLNVAPTRLRATCRAAGLTWFEDPTNAGDANARARLRRIGGLLEAEGLTVAALARTAARAAAQRRLLEGLTADLLARTVALSSWGYAEVDAAGLREADPELAVRALARVLAVAGGGAHPPRREALARLFDWARRGGTTGETGGGVTLAGCIVRVGGARRIIVCREPAAVALPVALAPGGRAIWDRRFVVELADGAPAGLAAGARGAMKGRPAGVPAAAWATSPAVLGPDSQPLVGGDAWLRYRFAPQQALADALFPVVSGDGDII